MSMARLSVLPRESSRVTARDPKKAFLKAFFEGECRNILNNWGSYPFLKLFLMLLKGEIIGKTIGKIPILFERSFLKGLLSFLRPF